MYEAVELEVPGEHAGLVPRDTLVQRGVAEGQQLLAVTGQRHLSTHRQPGDSAAAATAAAA